MIVLYGKIPFIFSFNIHSQLLPLATIWEIKRHKHFKVTNEQTRAQRVALFVLMPLNKLTSRTYCVFYILLVFSTCYTQCWNVHGWWSALALFTFVSLVLQCRSPTFSQLQDSLPANYFACRMNYRFPRNFSSSPSYSSSSTHCKQCLLLVIIIIIIIIIIILSSLLLNALVSPTQAKSRVSYHLTIINTGHCYVTLAAHPCCPLIPHTKRFPVGQG